MITIELSETRIEELELIFQKEINDYQNKIICREKFIYIIKEKCNFIEFCYLYNKYIGKPQIIWIPNINPKDFEVLIETKDNTSYNSKIKKKNYHNKYTKKLVKIESMSKNRYHK